jgi:hypothetical protein
MQLKSGLGLDQVWTRSGPGLDKCHKNLISDRFIYNACGINHLVSDMASQIERGLAWQFPPASVVFSTLL